MRFGPVATAEAEGAVLAHSVALPDGRLRKGVVLGGDDVAALCAAGIAQVIVAQLDPDDMGEDVAADLLADALLAQAVGLRRSAAFTGRVNLIADEPGVVDLDVAAIEAINAIDPMLTIATVPPFQQMASGGMVATIKMISYAVPRAAVEAACALATDALNLRAPVLPDATLIITEIPGGAGDKGKRAIEDRLSALGVGLVETVMVPHDQTTLAQAIAGARGALILILTGSATSDIADVAPAALLQAGGQVSRFGMPVDPGNLLFLGDLQGRAVIGLPGCARSPALNGADWVLSRVVCGVPVTAADIAGMGVGGLLKEIPTRPQPRGVPPKSYPT
ncbi:molybdopterin-binding protein [Sulfitobacter sp. S190]|uniref:molybdopterin-binding protein n=1 Tax=Sulfitobacter sp. S190 TaxID=2867022 RepID=UPI0021A3D55D|nr:molybdopterin-binding protein [Sulfitobacter sp. S190]UWR20995.1 molybdopterin-binding protein [Sulfitobacter sp. S190]